MQDKSIIFLREKYIIRNKLLTYLEAVRSPKIPKFFRMKNIGQTQDGGDKSQLQTKTFGLPQALLIFLGQSKKTE